MMPVVSRAEMRELDRLTIEVHGTPGHVLMERAGTGAAEVFWREFPRVRTHPVVIAGKGNNGGDGFVVARWLRKRGVRCDVVLLARAADVQGDAGRNLRAFVRGRGRLIEAPGETGVGTARAAMERSRIVIDAIFGTGLSAPVTGPTADVIGLINACGLPVFAIDVPSGLDADRGVPLGIAVQAEATATFGFPKTGLLQFPGADYAGTLAVVDIGIAPGAVESIRPSCCVWSTADVGAVFPPRPRDAHKGDAGHVCVIAGGRGKCGAAVLAAEAASRCGAGLTTLALPESERLLVATQLREVMTAGLAAGPHGLFASPAREELHLLLAGKSSVVVGPGIGVSDGTRTLVRQLISTCELPLVIDADGLNCIGDDVAVLRRRRGATVLTPHPGEMSRLTKTETSVIQADRLGAARRLAEETTACVVLKGARTVVAGPGGTAAINLTGNPGMASGGMGDVLAGMIGSLCGQGLDAEEAALVGVHIHGLAADLAAQAQGGTIGLLASDVIAALPRAIGVAHARALEGQPALRRHPSPGRRSQRRRST
jgi:NAD(P)H-hydrate epimerase